MFNYHLFGTRDYEYGSEYIHSFSSIEQAVDFIPGYPNSENFISYHTMVTLEDGSLQIIYLRCRNGVYEWVNPEAGKVKQYGR